MNVSELYMTLEVYAHLRELPQYSALKAAIEKTLKDENDALVPKAISAPKEEPAPEIETGFVGDEEEVRR
jgi:hypothetical protein